MVMKLTVVKAWIGQWLVIGQAEPGIRRLDPVTRVKVLAALAGLIILGFGMVLIAWLGGRAVRRYMRGRPTEPSWRPAARKSDDDWADRPLARDSDPSGPKPTSP
jgi:hypothetical protein